MVSIKKTVELIAFEWDSDKAAANIIKHGVSFDTAALVFLDELHVELYDSGHSTLTEDRYIAIGCVDHVLVVVYTERSSSIRIISARKATKEERNIYHDSSLYS